MMAVTVTVTVMVMNSWLGKMGGRQAGLNLYFEELCPRNIRLLVQAEDANGFLCPVRCVVMPDLVTGSHLGPGWR